MIICLAMEKFLSKSGTKRKFKEEYVEYGFIAMESDGDQLPFYLICNKALSNETFVPNKLKRHLETTVFHRLKVAACIWVFAEKSLDEFWLSLQQSYPALSFKAVKIILPFASSWFCEFGFSALTEIKSKKRERLLRIDEEMRLFVSNGASFQLDLLSKAGSPSH